MQSSACNQARVGADSSMLALPCAVGPTVRPRMIHFETNVTLGVLISLHDPCDANRRAWKRSA
jgi:hypothetical protein